MNGHFDFLSSPQELVSLLQQPDTWTQGAVIVLGMVFAWLLGRHLQRRLGPAISPDVMADTARTAVRGAATALVPIVLWAWLLAAAMVFRQWQQPAEVLRLAMWLTGALAAIRASVFILRRSAAPGSRLKAWEGTWTATIWLLVVLHILGWLQQVEEALDEYAVTIGSTHISLYTVGSFLFSIALALVVALALSNALQWRVRRSAVLDESLKIAIIKLGKFLLISVAVIVAMVAAGIDLTALAVFGGALGVGLGLGLQRIVSNFVSGVILGFEGSIHPGDVIRVGDTLGVIRALHARHVVVHTRDGRDVLIPNETLLTSDITNLSYADRNMRIGLPVQISYDDDPEAVIVLLEQVARAHPRVLADPPPQGCLVGFGDHGINLELRVWVNDPENGMTNMRSDINRAIWKALCAAGVAIPYPKRDIRIVETAPRSDR